MILIVDMSWKKDSLAYYEFVLPIVSAVDPLERCEVKHYLEVNPDSLEGYSKIILSGTALKDNAALSQPEKFQWLKTAEKPVLGICAGMETLGTVFGAHLSQSLEIGMTQITTEKTNLMFSGDFKAYSLHGVCIEPSDVFEVWAKSAKCIQAIKHKTKPIYGVLFHPEVRNQEILKRFIFNL